MGVTHIEAPPDLPFIDITREFDAPAQLVFRAHTDPVLLVDWLGPREFEMVIERYEIRDGGRWSYVHRDPGGREYAFHGVFHGTPSPDHTVQTSEFDGAPRRVSLETLTLVEDGGKTVLRVHAVYQSVEARDAQVQGRMAEGLDDGYRRLDEVLARLSPPR